MMKLTLKDFGHYYNSIKEIQSAIKNKQSVLCNGFSGCGKTTLIQLLIQDTNWDILEINASNYESLAITKRKIAMFMEFKSIVFFFQETSKLILIDDMDILSNTDRNFNSFFIDYFKNKTLNFPLICIANSNYEKKLGDTSKIFDKIIRFRKLSFQQCFQIATKYIDEDDENVDYEKITTLIKENSNDLRTVINHLDECKLNRTLSISSLRKRSRFFDLSIHEIVNVICTTLLNSEEINELLGYDTNQIVSILHENVYKSLKSSQVDSSEYKMLQKLNRICTESELTNRIIFDVYSTNVWEYQTYIKIASLNYYAFTYFSTKPDFVLQNHFPQIINKQSLAFNFNKKIIKMENNLSVSRSLFTFPLLVIFTFANAYVQKKIKSLPSHITKNELEVVLRFITEYDTERKSIIVKTKTSLR
jgi:DNA polymerase III delta prime subunit